MECCSISLSGDGHNLGNSTIHPLIYTNYINRVFLWSQIHWYHTNRSSSKYTDAIVTFCEVGTWSRPKSYSIWNIHVIRPLPSKLIIAILGMKQILVTKLRVIPRTWVTLFGKSISAKTKKCTSVEVLLSPRPRS